MEQLATYKYYDQQGRRMAIFGSLNGEALKVTAIPCSRKDHFSIQRAKELLKIGGKGNLEFLVIIDEEGKYKKAFMQFVKKFFQKPSSRNYGVSESIVKNGKKTVILNTREYHKMDYNG